MLSAQIIRREPVPTTTNTTIIKQLDNTTFLKNTQIAIDLQKAEVTNKLQLYQSEQQKTAARLTADYSSRINSFLTSKLSGSKLAEIKKELTNPYVSEVYYPNSTGVQPIGEFVLIGGNLLSSSGPTTVSVKLGQSVIGCEIIVKESSERLRMRILDFGGITDPAQATLTVTCNGLVSRPATITLLPALEIKKLDFTLLKNQLQSDLKSTSTLIYVNNIAEGKDHEYTILYTDMLWVNHDCPYSSNRTTEYRGTDEFFLTTQLKNKWVVKSYVAMDNRSVCGTVPDGQKSSFFYGNLFNSPSLYIKLGWYNNTDLCFQSGYCVTYIIEGPKGTNYW
jgi:hypothetical protein